MVRTKDSSNMERYALHIEGKGFDFVIDKVEPNPNNPDWLFFYLIPLKFSNGRCNMRVNVGNPSYMLKRFCEACGLNIKGGFDTNEFVGTKVICDVVHNEKNNKIYANIDPDSITGLNLKDDRPPF